MGYDVERHRLPSATYYDRWVQLEHVGPETSSYSFQMQHIAAGGWVEHWRQWSNYSHPKMNPSTVIFSQIVRRPTILRPQPWWGNCRLHFLTACNTSISKLCELQSELAAFSQKKTTYIRQTPPVSKPKSK